jgi:hypothetical protein
LQINQGIAKYYAAGLRKEAPETVSGKRTGSSSSGSRPARALTEEEKEVRKNIGIMSINFTFAFLMLLDSFYLWDKLWRFYLPSIFSWLPFVSAIVIGLPVSLILYLVLVKPAQK